MNTVEKIVEKLCKYERKGDKTISASQFGSEILQIYYSIVAKDNEVLFEIGQNDIGTLVHKGLDCGIKELDDENLQSEVELEYELTNGWKITGTCDLIEETDHGAIIHDYKVTKKYTAKKLREAIAKHDYTHQYILQLNAYRFMYEKKAKTTSTAMVLDMFIKDADKLKSEPTYEEIEIPRIEDDVVLTKAYEITTTVESYINAGVVPDKCSDVWTRKLRNGTVVDMKCFAYCDYKNICKYYNNRGKTDMETSLGGWG
jgi:hypothetical protein